MRRSAATNFGWRRYLVIECRQAPSFWTATSSTHRPGALAIVVREFRVEPAYRIEAVVDVDPAAGHLLVREAVGLGPARLQLVLDLVEAERAAQRDEAVDLGAAADALQAVVRDDRAHAVRDDDVRAGDGAGAERVHEALADGLLDPHRRAARRRELDVEEIVVHVAQEHVHDRLLQKPRQRHALERALRRGRDGRRRRGDLFVAHRREPASQQLEEGGLLRRSRLRRRRRPAGVDRFRGVLQHALVRGEVLVRLLVHEVRPVHEVGGDVEVAERQRIRGIRERFPPEAQEVGRQGLVRDAVDEGDVGHDGVSGFRSRRRRLRRYPERAR